MKSICSVCNHENPEGIESCALCGADLGEALAEPGRDDPSTEASEEPGQVAAEAASEREEPASEPSDEHAEVTPKEPDVAGAETEIGPALAAAETAIAPSLPGADTVIGPSVASAETIIGPSVASAETMIGPSVASAETMIGPSVASAPTRVGPSVASAPTKVGPSTAGAPTTVLPLGSGVKKRTPWLAIGGVCALLFALVGIYFSPLGSKLGLRTDAPTIAGTWMRVGDKAEGTAVEVIYVQDAFEARAKLVASHLKKFGFTEDDLMWREIRLIGGNHYRGKVLYKETELQSGKIIRAFYREHDFFFEPPNTIRSRSLASGNEVIGTEQRWQKMNLK